MPVSVEVSVAEDDFVRMRLVLGVPVPVLVSEAVEEGVPVDVGVRVLVPVDVGVPVAVPVPVGV